MRNSRVGRGVMSMYVCIYICTSQLEPTLQFLDLLFTNFLLRLFPLMSVSLPCSQQLQPSVVGVRNTKVGRALWQKLLAHCHYTATSRAPSASLSISHCFFFSTLIPRAEILPILESRIYICGWRSFRQSSYAFPQRFNEISAKCYCLGIYKIGKMCENKTR